MAETNGKTVERLVVEFDTKIIETGSICCEIGTPCLICGDGVPVFGYAYAPKICEKCKAAVMKVRAEDGNT